jgi:nitrite reductase (NADH) small subunit
MTLSITRHLLGPIDQIPLGEARVFRVDGLEVAVFRLRSGELLATGATCPHRGGPLADGLVGGHSVVCPLHGFLFDLRTGGPIGRDCAHLQTYRVTSSASGELSLEIP